MKIVLVAALASLLLATASAIADGRDAAAADVLFREGRALMKKGDYQAACPKLAESHRLDPAAGTAVNLGDCVEKLGKLADALQAYRDALELLPKGDFRFASVKEQIAVLEKKAPRLTIKLAPGAPRGTRVMRDDVELGEASLGVALPVNPGEHVIVVSAPGRGQRVYVAKLREGEIRELEVIGGKAEKPRAAYTDAERPREHAATGELSTGDGTRTAGFVVGIMGLAAGVFGGVAFVEAHRHEGFSKSKDDGEYALAQTWQTVGAVSLVVGGAGVATGVVLLFAAKPHASTKDSALGVAPTFGADRAGCVVGGRW